MFFLSIVLAAVVTACLPLIIPRLIRFRPAIKLQAANPWLPVLAGVLMVVSTQLPNIHISNETTTFQQHFVGGGMYSACLYLYAKQLLGWRLNWLINVLALFALTSAFGVVNKLVEFAFLKLHLAHISTSDTDWDLLANTLGSFFGYVVIQNLFTAPKPRKAKK